MSDRRARYSQLAPLTIEERKHLSLLATKFFSPLQYRGMCAAIDKVAAPGKSEPLDGFEFLKFLEKTGQFPEPDRHRRQINELLLQLSDAHMLAEMGWGKEAYIGRRYYFLREFTEIEQQGILWLAPALGAEFVLQMFASVVVQLVGVKEPGDVRAGTGLTIAPNWLLTCAHVLRDMKLNPAQSFAGREYTVVDTRSHPDVDVGLVKVEPSLQCLKGLAFRDPVITETVFTIGYPRVPMSKKPSLLMHRGEITNTEIVTFSGQNLFLYSAIARPGNSGGPVIAATGNVVGIVTEELNEKSNDFQTPFYGGVGTREIVRVIGELEPVLKVPVEDYQ